MNRALWLLLRLQMGGWLRYVGRGVQTLRGVLLVLIGLSAFVPWILTMLLAPGTSVTAGDLLRYGPALLMFYCVVNVVVSSHDRAIYFTPAEVQFLFSGPFGRREILAYKILLTILVSIPATLIMGAFLRVRNGWMPATLLGLLLTSIFMSLFSMALGLLANTVGERLYSRGQRVVVAVLLVLAAVIFFQTGGHAGIDWQRLADDVFATQTWQVVTWPLRSFFEVMLARQLWPDLLSHLLVASSVVVVLFGVIFSLDARYEEAAAATSARVYARIQRLRGRAVNVEAPVTARTVRWEVPTIPYLGGVGPIFWRQLTGALRGLGRLLWVLFVIGVVIAVPILSSGVSGTREALVPVLVVLGSFLAVFLTAMVPFDFRGDIDRMASLKTLPIVPWRLALGQLLTPTFLLTLMQWLTLGFAMVLSPERMEVWLAVAAFVPVFSFVVMGLENLLFLLFPVRIMAATPGDFQAMGRNVLLSIGKMAGLSGVGMAAVLVGMLAFVVSGEVWVGGVAGWMVFLVAGVVLVPLCGWAFTWFDVGRDTPA